MTDTETGRPEPIPYAANILRRHRDLSLSLDFTRDSYVAAPRAEQRHWVINRAVNELLEQLRHLDMVAPEYVGGATRDEIESGEWSRSTATYTGDELLIEGQQVMQNWEIPLMLRLAEVVTEGRGDVLEVGFGLGLSATFIEDLGVRSHTIVEFNSEVAEVARAWAERRPPGSDIEILHGSWQERCPRLGLFDGMIWDAFPTSEREFDQYVLRDSTVAESFFPVASAHLRKGGIFTYYTNEEDSLSRRHQRCLLRYFSSFGVEVVSGLRPPDDCEYWWSDRMCVVRAVK